MDERYDRMLVLSLLIRALARVPTRQSLTRKTPGSFEASLGDQVTPPDVAAVAYASDTGSSGSLDHTLITILFQNGTVVMHWQEFLDGPWQMGLAPAEVNATALALDHDLRAYSLSVGGLIQEWQIDGSDPTVWRLVSNVTTA